MDMDTARNLALVAARARVERPRLFAMHGLSRAGHPLLGWGMEFEDRDDTIFYLPANAITHHTVSAERVVRRYASLGDVDLTWFDE